jgi:hypothetical protein
MDFLHIVDALHGLTEQISAHLMFAHEDTIFISADGQVSTTKPKGQAAGSIAPAAAVWWLQNPQKTFEALTISVLN